LYAWYEYSRAVFDIYYGGSKHYLETWLQVVFWTRLKKLKTRYVVAAERMQWDSIPYEEDYDAFGGSSYNCQTCIAVSCVPFVGNLNKDETFSLLYTAAGESTLKIVGILTYNVPCTRIG